jgi:4-hydroxy-3-methylbut-2-enyl diphosphate reductase
MVEFSNSHDVVLFVAGRKSSNGKALFNVCSSHNPRSYFIEKEGEINMDWFEPQDHVGICGATSTPRWLMERVADFLKAEEQKVVLN